MQEPILKIREEKNMLNWNFDIVDGKEQSLEISSFIGGKPKIPIDITIPRCSLCNNELTFLFQVDFPLGHDWYGKSLAVFFCTATFHNQYCIPMFPKVSDLCGANITSEFLKRYSRNFRTIVFDSEKGVVRGDYEEKVKFKTFQIRSKNEIDNEAPFSLGGTPIWIMGVDETPSSIDGKELTLLMQIKEDYWFDITPSAPPQATIMNRYRSDGKYELFAADRIYFWGVKDMSTPLIYISVQAP